MTVAELIAKLAMLPQDVEAKVWLPGRRIGLGEAHHSAREQAVLIEGNEEESAGQVVKFARDCFRSMVCDLLDDPTWLLAEDEAYRTNFFRANRQLARALDLDYDELVAKGSALDRERLAKLEKRLSQS